MLGQQITKGIINIYLFIVCTLENSALKVVLKATVIKAAENYQTTIMRAGVFKIYSIYLYMFSNAIKHTTISILIAWVIIIINFIRF